MFLPTTKAEMKKRGWDALDVILVSGDAYIDAPQIGIAVVGNVLVDAGFRVGIIPQPDVSSPTDISVLGEPRLFWGISAGSVDSMVANYTALLKKRRSDDYTPGGRNTRRPDRATIIYANLIRQHFKNTVPIVLGGLEASLRRIAHYDYWKDGVRRSVLFDAKADLIAYGMSEQTVLLIAQRLRENEGISGIRGTCEITSAPPAEYAELPSYEEASKDKAAFLRMYDLFYRNTDPITASGLAQQHGNRWLVQHPPAPYETQQQLDALHDRGFEWDAHPRHREEGKIPALDTIRFSVQTHRGCYGECNFCAIAVHEGRRVRWRSENNIVREVESFRDHPRFRGVVPDVGGPTANMYGFECEKKIKKGVCEDKRCVFPEICRQLPVDHGRYTRLLQRLRKLRGIRHIFVASGIRHDMVVNDERCGMRFMEELVTHHVSGQLKLAPEHSDPEILDLMGKQGTDELLDFREKFFTISRKSGKKQFLTYYFIAAYPGCEEKHMQSLRRFAATELQISPEQVQVFTPTPGTWASVMYWTEQDPVSGRKLQVEKGLKGKRRQKDVLTDQHGKQPTRGKGKRF